MKSKFPLLSLAVGAVVAAAALGEVHLTIRPDGRKLIYNDDVDTRRYRPVDMSDGWIIRTRHRPTPYDRLIVAAARQHQLDPRLVKSVMLVESGYNPSSVSRKGARGLMQLMPDTALRYGVRRIFNPVENILGGVRYLTYLLSLFDGDLEHSLAAYNAGENAVLKYGGIPPYDETQLYVHKTLTAYYGRPYLAGGFSRPRTSQYRSAPAAPSSSGLPVSVLREPEGALMRLTTDPGRSR